MFHWHRHATLLILSVLMSARNEANLTDESGVTVRCLFFARYAELLGCAEFELELSRGSTVADAVELVRAQAQGGHQLPKEPLVAKNQRHVKYDSAVEDGDELAFLPPLAGG